MTPPMIPSDQHLRQGRRIVWWIAGMFGALMLLIVARIISGNIEPRVSLPAPGLPNPNAFDVFVKAGKMCTPGKEAKDALGDMVNRHPKKMWTLAQKEAFLQPNLPSLQILRNGLNFSYREPVNRSFDVISPYFSDFRNMARLLKLEGDIHRAKGENGVAMKSYLDALQLGQKIPQGAPLIGGLVGIACQAIARRSAWETIASLNALEARNSLQQVQAIQSNAFPLAGTFREESYFGQAALLEVFRNQAKKSSDPSENTFNFSRAQTQMIYFAWGKRGIMNNHDKFMEELIALSKNSYGSHPDLPPIPPDLMNRTLLPVFGAARIRWANNNTQNGLLTVSQALQAYKAEHGNRYPETLSQLCPAYLLQIPVDTFAVSGPLCYKKTQTGYVLYSVGPDGQDDFGNPIADYKPTSGPASEDSSHFVMKYSKGDIVAGINQ